MRRIVLALMSTVTAVVLLFGYRTSTASPTPAATSVVAGGSTASGSAAGGSTASGSAAGAGTTTAPAPSPTAAGSRTVTGQTVQTRWGPVQLQVTVSGTRLTAVTVLQQPSGNGRDVEINAAALPVLQQEALQAQSAHIDTVSGATVTSDGYISSLQSALDQAGL